MDGGREDPAARFRTYPFRMVPVVDAEDRIQGGVHPVDIMKPNAKAWGIATPSVKLARTTRAASYFLRFYLSFPMLLLGFRFLKGYR